jgi:hypothetical protein
MQDKARQLHDLEAQLEARRRKKLEKEQKDLHNQELELLADPSTRSDAAAVALSATVAVRQEVDAARMLSALQEQESLEMEHAREQADSAAQAVKAEAQALLQKRISHEVDDNLRQELLKQHELDLARINAEAAVARGRVEHDLQARLAEKKKKRRDMLDVQHKKENEALKEGGKTRTIQEVEAELERLRQESGIAIRQEEEMAKVAYDMLAEAKAEIRALKEELKEKAQETLRSEELRLQDTLANTDVSSEQREKLLREHEDDVRRIKSQLAADEAKQVSGLESKLAARKAKRQKKLETAHAKELEEVHAVAEKQDNKIHQESEPVNLEEAKQKLEKEFKEQEEAELEAMREKMRKEKETLLQDELQKLQKQLASDVAAEMNDEDRQKLIAANETNMKRLEAYMDKERLRQEDELRAQLQAKKAKKEAKLQAQLDRKSKEQVGFAVYIIHTCIHTHVYINVLTVQTTARVCMQHGA